MEVLLKSKRTKATLFDWQQVVAVHHFHEIEENKTDSFRSISLRIMENNP